MGRKKGKTIKHKSITVSQADDYDEYQRQYYKKVLKKKRADRRKRIEGQKKTIENEEEER